MLRIWSVLAFVSVMTVSTMATARHLMEDPLFGITYDAHIVNFQPIPASLLMRCPDLKAEYVRGWIYGRLKTADSEYFLVSGLMTYRRGGGKGAPDIAPDESGGLAVAVRGQKCLVDQADYFLTQTANPAAGATSITVPRSILDGILEDAFERYVKAFGGKEKFLKQVTPDAIGPHIVREELERFEQTSDDSHRRDTEK
jgi:hypothetical protein